jgi:HSP20 family protein
MRYLSHEMDRMFAGESGRSGENWWPSVEVVERDGNMVVRADLPGIKQEDVKVEVTDGDLQIRGERRREHEERGRGYYRSERAYGTFSRCIPLPEGAQTDKARAQFNNGVLEVSVPVPEHASKARQIPIEAGAKKP